MSNFSQGEEKSTYIKCVGLKVLRDENCPIPLYLVML